MVMLDYTVDILLIGLITVFMIQSIKTPIKAILEKKGLKDSVKMQNTFKAIMTLFSYGMCFAGACVYFRFYMQIPLFEDSKIVGYTVGAVGASQSIYNVIETYGRDGLLAIIKAIIDRVQTKKTTDLSAIPSVTIEELAEQIVSGINERYDGAPVTAEDVKQILEKTSHS